MAATAKGMEDAPLYYAIPRRWENYLDNLMRLARLHVDTARDITEQLEQGHTAVFEMRCLLEKLHEVGFAGIPLM